MNNLAWLLATASTADLRNGNEAVKLASRAVELTASRRPVFIGTLAAAYAEAGQLDKAVETSGIARDLARSLGQSDLAVQNENLRNKYAAKLASQNGSLKPGLPPVKAAPK